MRAVSDFEMNRRLPYQLYPALMELRELVRGSELRVSVMEKPDLAKVSRGPQAVVLLVLFRSKLAYRWLVVQRILHSRLHSSPTMQLPPVIPDFPWSLSEFVSE